MNGPTAGVVTLNMRRAAIVKVLRDKYGGGIHDHLDTANAILEALDAQTRHDPAANEALNVLQTWSRGQTAVPLDRVVAAVALLVLNANGGAS